MSRPAGRPRHGLRILGIVTTGLLLLGCCAGVASSYLLGGLAPKTDTFAFGCGRQGAPIDLQAKLPRVGVLGDEQMRNAAVIIQVGQQLGVPPRGWVIAIATALQESRLRNLPNLGADNDHDSLGLFQQRPSAGWGTPEQIMNPEYAARKFYEHLVKIKNWERMALTVAAQLVQISAFPDAYAKHEPLATQIVNVLADGAARAVGALADLRCVSAGEITASGWTIPAQGPLGSGFRTADRPGHNGVDIRAARWSEIHAASSGVVATVRCETSGPDCNRDGGLNVRGCGWYVEIDHASGVMTRYCHMQQRPRVSVGQQVAAGDVIGLVGSSGNSTGPHLHFEVHTGGGTGSSSAVDPVEFMRQVGAPLDGAA